MYGYDSTHAERFRKALYQNFNKRADTLMDLLDAMCSMPEARSVVEYSLASCFPRSYSTVFKAVNEMKLEDLWLANGLPSYLRDRRRGRFGS